MIFFTSPPTVQNSKLLFEKMSQCRKQNLSHPFSTVSVVIVYNQQILLSQLLVNQLQIIR